MHNQRLLGCILGLSVLQIGAVMGANINAQASPHPWLNNNEIELAGGLTAQIAQSLPSENPAATDYETYVEPGQFSVEYPAGWQVDRTDNQSVQITSYSPSSDKTLTQTEDIKIQIWLIPEDPAAIVDSALSDISQGGPTLRNYTAATVDGQPALMLWLTGEPLEFPNAIHTYVGYGNQETAVIFSSYTASNPDAEVVIDRINASFNRQQQADNIAPQESQESQE